MRPSAAAVNSGSRLSPVAGELAGRMTSGCSEAVFAFGLFWRHPKLKRTNAAIMAIFIVLGRLLGDINDSRQASLARDAMDRGEEFLQIFETLFTFNLE